MKKSEFEKVTILVNLKLCKDRVDEMEKAISDGKHLTKFGLWLFEADKKAIAKYEKKLELLNK